MKIYEWSPGRVMGSVSPTKVRNDWEGRLRESKAREKAKAERKKKPSDPIRVWRNKTK